METEVFAESGAPSDLQDGELPPEAVGERTDEEQLDTGYHVSHTDAIFHGKLCRATGLEYRSVTLPFTC